MTEMNLNFITMWFINMSNIHSCYKAFKESLESPGKSPQVSHWCVYVYVVSGNRSQLCIRRNLYHFMKMPFSWKEMKEPDTITR